MASRTEDPIARVKIAIQRFPTLSLRLERLDESPSFGDYEAILRGPTLDVRVTTDKGLPSLEVGRAGSDEWWEPRRILEVGGLYAGPRLQRLQTLEEELAAIATAKDKLHDLLNEPAIVKKLRYSVR